LLTPDAHQLPLAGILPSREDPGDEPPPPTETIKAYQRRTRLSALPDAGEEGGLRFDASVPVHVRAIAGNCIALGVECGAKETAKRRSKIFTRVGINHPQRIFS
jgi:hypothetical protein